MLTGNTAGPGGHLTISCLYPAPSACVHTHPSAGLHSTLTPQLQVTMEEEDESRGKTEESGEDRADGPPDRDPTLSPTASILVRLRATWGQRRGRGSRGWIPLGPWWEEGLPAWTHGPWWEGV